VESGGETARVDAWLWSVRRFPTRSVATSACRAGHVRVNGKPAKAATIVVPGDTVEVRGSGHPWVAEVVRPITKRVGAPIAATCFVDRSPPRPPSEDRLGAGLEVRDRGAGRPTKRDRRLTDRLKGR